MIGDQPVEEADAPAGGPTLIELAARRVHGGAGDIEVRPGGVLDEALDELGGGDGAGVAAAADVLYVCVLAVDQLVVGLVEGHAPDLLPCASAGALDLLGQLVVVGEEAGVLLAESDDD